MANIIFVSPTDQPIGKFRMIDWLNTNLQNDNYDEFVFSVAFAKVRPLYFLDDSIRKWKTKGKRIRAVFGIDHMGTSIETLIYALNVFDETYIINAKSCTFHPKIYTFYGKKSATGYFGSSNFTTGGLELNFESGIIYELDLPSDQILLNQSLECFNYLLPEMNTCCRKLDEELISLLVADGKLLDEAAYRSQSAKKKSSKALRTQEQTQIFGEFRVKPPKAIPKKLMEETAKTVGIKLSSNNEQLKKGIKIPSLSSSIGLITTGLIESLVIQIRPQENGEILLSKKALSQNQDFFGYPFSGLTTPKLNMVNRGYPQRDPDPLVNIFVYDDKGNLIRTEANYSLNMVHYQKKEEIRITVRKEYLSGLPKFDEASANYPILVMTKSKSTTYDYDLSFYSPGSSYYRDYLLICDQSLPPGGKKVPRKMGWL